MQTLFDNINDSWVEDNVLWFFSEIERDKEIKKLEISVGTDKFGNLLNGRVPTAMYVDGKGFVKYGITIQ